MNLEIKNNSIVYLKNLNIINLRSLIKDHSLYIGMICQLCTRLCRINLQVLNIQR